MIFDSEGVLRGDGGVELARVEIAPDQAYAALSIGAERYEILKPSALGLAGSVLVEGHTAPPALDLALPATLPLGSDLARLLAFACWPIEQREVQAI